MCQEVGWQGVVVGFEATLRVHHEGAVGKLTKEVETVEHHRKVGLGEIAREAGIPHQIVGIAGGIGEGLVFRKGEILRKVPEDQLVSELFAEIDKILLERKVSR